MSVYVTADLHLGHRLVAGLRGYSDVEGHDRDVMAGIAALTRRDQLWVLGDVTAGSQRAEDIALTKLAGVAVKLHLVAGNHDSCHPMNRRTAHKRFADFAEVFASVSSAARRRHGVYELLLSHMPYDGDHTEDDRFAQFRLRDLGVPLIHGHTHSAEQFSRSTSGTPQLCVSLEAWEMQPVALDDVVQLLEAAHV